jgi:hypothetical protein
VLLSILKGEEMRIIISILSTVIIAIIIIACKTEVSDASEQLSVLKGTVYYMNKDEEPTPLYNALVSIKNFYALPDSSDAEGKYELEVNLEEEMLLKLEASHVGFYQEEIDVYVKPGEEISVQDITLRSVLEDSVIDIEGPPITSGDPAHIEINEYHLPHIYVAGCGMIETAKINFNIMDDQGRLVDQNHAATVHFSLLNGPGGGEYISPDTMVTEKGLVYTVLNSGTIAGPVQIQAWMVINDNIISSTPVRIAIYGGLPDKDHFSLALDRANIAGLKYRGITNTVTAFVGDKYSNPVAPGTIIYFSTDFGIVDGAGTTDNLGRAITTYVNAEPLPPNPVDSAYVHITGWTYGDTLSTNERLYTKARLLLTGSTIITVDPVTFTFSRSDSVTGWVEFNYRVADIYNRPLVGGSTIKVETKQGEVSGDIDFSLEDGQAPGPVNGYTDFSFRWSPGKSIDYNYVAVSISVTTPAFGNGNGSIIIYGTITD